MSKIFLDWDNNPQQEMTLFKENNNESAAQKIQTNKSDKTNVERRA